MVIENFKMDYEKSLLHIMWQNTRSPAKIFLFHHSIIFVLKNIFPTKETKLWPQQQSDAENSCSLPFLTDTNSLINVNICNYLVDCQLKSNRLIIKNFNEHINVILRKKGTHSDPADFLHADFFSLVISTFIQAVKIIILLPGWDWHRN